MTSSAFIQRNSARRSRRLEDYRTCMWCLGEFLKVV